MLRESAKAFGYDVDLTVVRDPNRANGIPGGSNLLRLVDATLASPESLPTARNAVMEELGAEALVDAAAVFGNFEMMNRVADATGIPVAGAAIERERELISRLDIAGFQHHGGGVGTERV